MAGSDILAVFEWLADCSHSRTTTELTTSFATGIANLLGLSNIEKGVEVVVRAVSAVSFLEYELIDGFGLAESHLHNTFHHHYDSGPCAG